MQEPGCSDEKVDELIAEANEDLAEIASWVPRLQDFKDNTYSEIYEPFGFTFPEAWMAYIQNRTLNELKDICALLEDKEII